MLNTLGYLRGVGHLVGCLTLYLSSALDLMVMSSSPTLVGLWAGSEAYLKMKNKRQKYAKDANR